MNPNSISHRLFAASLSHANQTPAKRPVRELAKASAKTSAPRGAAAHNSTPKMPVWSWSGWQQTTI